MQPAPLGEQKFFHASLDKDNPLLNLYYHYHFVQIMRTLANDAKNH